MDKKRTQCYLLLGTLLMLLVAVLCSFTFVKGNLDRSYDKSKFESTYATSVDYIIPGPSYSQIEELENGDNGISVVTPYSETSAPLYINGKPANGTSLFFPFEDKMEYTPYSSLRVVKGDYSTQGGSALADMAYFEKNGCDIGDVLTITISGHEYSFQIKAVTQTNEYYDGTIALILTGDDSAQMQADGIDFSAAYVSAKDSVKCKAYLETEYRPLGRLKDKTEFSSEETYNQHVQNFNDADWSKEITDCRGNYEKLSAKYENVQTTVWINIAVMSIIVLTVIAVFNLVLLKHDSIQKFMRAFLIKKSGTKDAVKNFYKSGIRANAIVFIVSMIALYVFLSARIHMQLFSLQMLNCVIPSLVSAITSAIMGNICSNYVETHYRIKQKKETAEIEVEII